MPPRLYLAIAAFGAATLLATSPATAAPRTFTVLIDKMKFGPVPVDLKRGDAIVWINRDILRHSATASDHSFDADLPPGTKIRAVLNKSGTINFSCRYHPGMRGTLRVR